MSLTVANEAGRLFARSRADGILVAGAAAHAAVLVLFPSAPVIGVLMWWNANTIAHWFLHGRFFASPALNAAFSAFLSILLGFPQALWEERHRAHHEGRPARLPRSARMLVETALVLGLWAGLLAAGPAGFLTVYLPGWILGMALAALQGRGEHRGGPAIDHRGRLYNFLFANDGYHVAHHAEPGLHWTRLPSRSRPDAPTQALPPVLCSVAARPLDLLERVALAFPAIRRFLLRRHERAMRALLGGSPPPRRAAVVGGGLFPRSALLLRRLFPEAEVTVIERDPAHLETARRHLPDRVRTVVGTYDPTCHRGFDLVVLPLSYAGDREALCSAPPAPRLLVHDWLWRRRERGATVSLFLLKRMHLVERSG